MGDDPAISISISSNLVSNQDLNDVATSAGTPDGLVDLWVGDETSSLKGQIVEISGPVGDHRARLMALTQREDMVALIEEAPDEELVVQVRSGRNEYEYVASALGILLRTEDFRRFGISASRALGALRIEPKLRSELVGEVSELLKDNNLVGSAHNSRERVNRFLTARTWALSHGYASAEVMWRPSPKGVFSAVSGGTACTSQMIGSTISPSDSE